MFCQSFEISEKCVSSPSHHVLPLSRSICPRSAALLLCLPHTNPSFTARGSIYGKAIDVELIENGADVDVTNDNRDEYVELYVNYKLNKSVEKVCTSIRVVLPQQRIGCLLLQNKLLSPLLTHGERLGTAAIPSIQPWVSLGLWRRRAHTFPA